MNPTIDTSRLLLSEFTHDDTAFVVSLLNSPGWLQYIGDRNVHTAEEAIAYLYNGPIKSYKDHGFGLWRVDLKSAAKPIGMCGILKRPELDSPDLGFAFLPEYQRQGFAFEAAEAAIRFARERLKLPDLLAIVQPDNQASIRLLLKTGFTFVKQVKAGAKMETLSLYQLKLQEP